MSDTVRTIQYNGNDYMLLPAKREDFIRLKNWLTEIAEELKLIPKHKKQLLIVADEIFTNIASYGYPKSDGDARVAISFDMSSKELTMKFSDNGLAYNPLETQEPVLGESKVGGLGIYMVKKMMDSVSYSRENDWNILVLKKNIINME